jgi:hypothetical protein
MTRSGRVVFVLGRVEVLPVNHLPPDFAGSLARVLEPGDRAAAAGIIEAATRLDDDGLRVFLEMFGARIRASQAPVRREELQEFLDAAREGGRAASP